MEAGEGAKLHGYGYTAGYSWIVHRKSWLHEFHRPGFTVVVLIFATHDHCIT
jgi:hypothetical protein